MLTVLGAWSNVDPEHHASRRPRLSGEFAMCPTTMCATLTYPAHGQQVLAMLLDTLVLIRYVNVLTLIVSLHRRAPLLRRFATYPDTTLPPHPPPMPSFLPDSMAAWLTSMHKRLNQGVPTFPRVSQFSWQDTACVEVSAYCTNLLVVGWRPPYVPPNHVSTPDRRGDGWAGRSSLSGAWGVFLSDQVQ